MRRCFIVCLFCLSTGATLWAQNENVRKAVAPDAVSAEIDGLLDLNHPDPDPQVEPGLSDSVLVQKKEAQITPSDQAAQDSQKVELVDFVDDEPPAVPVRNDTKVVAAREVTGEPVLRGPIHEAFADPFAAISEKNRTIRKAPPKAIEEIPPALPQQVSNMRWIPGYWAWDMQRKDYLWVSGVWRKVPKGRVWVPGRWEEVERGFQWASGGWMPSDEQGVIAKKEVLPLPPKSLEHGPTSPAPSDQHFWIPGVWEQNAGEYGWRPGYWSRSQQNWVWVPDRYARAPGGCLFVPGYWDYTWERRGTLYAPCTFKAQQLTGSVRFRPTNLIDTNQWLLNLWVGPQTRSYYFGDYRDCARQGYTPWYSFYGTNRSVYDPFYSYYRWQFPTTYGIGLYGYLNGLHTHYNSHAALRPSVRIRPYDQFGRPYYGTASLFGDVRGLSRLVDLSLHDQLRHRRDFYDDYYDYHRHHRGSGYRSRDDFGSWPRSQVQPRPQRRLLGYANGAPLWSDDRTGRVKRSEIGVPRSRQFDSQDRSATPRVQPTPRTVEKLGPARLNPGSPPRSPVNAVKRPANALDRANGGRTVAGQSNRRGNATADVLRERLRTPVQRSTVARPVTDVLRNRTPRINSQPSQSRPVRKTESRTPVTRPNPVTRPKSTARSNPVVKPRAKVASPARSNPGFSISGMKNSRSKSDVQRQRAAMQKLIQDRKGRK